MEFEPPFTWLIIGSSGSGKTRLLKDILHSDLMKKFTNGDEENVIIMSPTMQYSGDFKEFEMTKDLKQNRKMFYDFNAEVIQDLIAEMKFVIKHYGKERTPHVLLILDDCLENVNYHSIINTLFIKGRHFNVSTIVLCQQLKRVSRTMRINAKYLTCFRCGNSSEFEDVLDEYVGKKEKPLIRDQANQYLNNNLWSYLHCNLKTQDFKKRYALGRNGAIEHYIEWF